MNFKKRLEQKKKEILDEQREISKKIHQTIGKINKNINGKGEEN